MQVRCQPPSVDIIGEIVLVDFDIITINSSLFFYTVKDS